jgi:hypothetical protein
MKTKKKPVEMVLKIPLKTLEIISTILFVPYYFEFLPPNTMLIIINQKIIITEFLKKAAISKL